MLPANSRLLCVGALVCLGYCPTVSAQCKTSLSYLSDQIPAVNNEKLTELRDQILKTKIKDIIAAIRERGLSLEKAAEQMLEQSSEYDGAMRETAASIKKISCEEGDVRCGDGPSYSEIMRKLKARNYSGLSLDGMIGSLIGTYIATDWGKLANQESAVQVICYAKQ